MTEEYKMPEDGSKPASKLTEEEAHTLECLMREIWVETWKAGFDHGQGRDGKDSHEKLLETFRKLTKLGFYVA